MLENQIMAACLRWHTAQQHRMEVGAELREIRKSNRDVPYLLQKSDMDASRRLTAAKRRERAALRKLAALCAEMRDGNRQAETMPLMWSQS